MSEAPPMILKYHRYIANICPFDRAALSMELNQYAR